MALLYDSLKNSTRFRHDSSKSLEFTLMFFFYVLMKPPRLQLHRSPLFISIRFSSTIYLELKLFKLYTTCTPFFLNLFFNFRPLCSTFLWSGFRMSFIYKIDCKLSYISLLPGTTVRNVSKTAQKAELNSRRYSLTFTNSE